MFPTPVIFVFCFFFFTLNFYKIGPVLPTDREIESDSRFNYELVCRIRVLIESVFYYRFLQYAQARPAGGGQPGS